MTIDQAIQLGTDIISKMGINQYIQLGIAVILAFTAVILTLTLPFIIWQVWVQRLLLKVQLQYNQIEMYVKANVPVSVERIQELKLYPEDYMDVKVYETLYKGNDDAIHRYIFFYSRYEYLAFSLEMPQKGEILNKKSLIMWTNDLCEEKEFYEVHKHCHEYYPDFAEVVEKLLKKKKKVAKKKAAKEKARLKQSKSKRKREAKSRA